MSEHETYLHVMFLCLNVLRHKVLKFRHQVVNRRYTYRPTYLVFLMLQIISVWKFHHVKHYGERFLAPCAVSGGYYLCPQSEYVPCYSDKRSFGGRPWGWEWNTSGLGSCPMVCFSLTDVVPPNCVEYRYGFILSMGFLSLLLISEMADFAK